MNAQVKAELDGIFQKEREPLLQVQIVLADITDKALNFRAALRSYADGETEQLTPLLDQLDLIVHRLAGLNDEFFNLEFQQIDARQFGLDFPSAGEVRE